MTWGLTTLILLFLCLPAWDDSIASKSDSLKLQSEWVERSHTLVNRDVLRARLARLNASGKMDQVMIDAEAAERVREDVMQLVRTMNCQMKRLTVSDARKRQWAQDDDPFDGSPPDMNGDLTPFVLESRELNLSVTGDLRQLSRLIVSLNQLDPFAVPSEMTLRRETDGGHLQLNVNVSLFNLVETHD